jgi:hypothetical protein
MISYPSLTAYLGLDILKDFPFEGPVRTFRIEMSLKKISAMQALEI